MAIRDKHFILNEYYQVIDNASTKIKDIEKNSEMYSDKWKVEQIEKVKADLVSSQAKYKKEYTERLQYKIEDTRSMISTDIPSILNDIEHHTEKELQFLANKYKDNYFASKKIERVALEKGYPIKFEYKDQIKELEKLEKDLENVGTRFSSDPFSDTIEAKMRQAMGLSDK